MYLLIECLVYAEEIFWYESSVCSSASDNYKQNKHYGSATFSRNSTDSAYFWSCEPSSLLCAMVSKAYVYSGKSYPVKNL